MLTDEQLEILGDALAPLYQHLEQEVIADVARRIKKTMTYTRTAELQAMSMRKLGYSPARIRSMAMKIINADPEYRKAVARNTLEYKKEVKDIINGITKEAYKTSNDVVANAGNMSWVNDLAVWKQAGKVLTDNGALSQLVEAFAAQTAGELKNLTKTAGFKTMSGYESVQNLYSKELDKAVIKICSGTFSQDKVLRDVVHDLAQSGLRSIDYKSGYSMQLDTAARLALRTGCHQLSEKMTDKNIEQTGENLVYVSGHSGARNTGIGVANHAQWQSKVYYIKPGTDYSGEAKRIGQDRIMDIWYSTGYSPDGAHTNNLLGLDGYNCRHKHFVWFLGVSSLPPENPEPKPVVINGKEYDYYAITQKMRSMERSIRALKREKDANKQLGIDNTRVNAKISQKTREYKEFCISGGTPAKTTKLRYESGTSDIKKTNAYKAYTNTVNNATINTVENTKEVSGVHTIGKLNKDIYKCVEGDIITDEVIITNERIQHIKDRHPNDFERYCGYMKEIIESPDYIIETSKPKTALILKEFNGGKDSFKTVLRLTTSTDNQEFKNSIITFMKINEKEWSRLIRNKKNLYKRE